MRIAYIAHYQGPTLLKNRPCQHNLSLAARVKIQLVAESLQNSSHEVEIISQGAVESEGSNDKRRFKFYPSFAEERFSPGIPVYYTSAVSLRYLTGFWESLQAQRFLKARHKINPFDAVIIYNLERAQIGCAKYAMKHLGLPVILQYEDDSLVNVHGRKREGIISKYHRRLCRSILATVSGGMAVSPYLMSQMPAHIPKVLLRGVVSEQIRKLRNEDKAPKKNWVVFSGTHEGTQGLEQMIRAWIMVQPSDWELHIAGQGPLTATLHKIAGGNPSIIFHGLLNREENARLLCAAKIGMNPQDPTITPGNVFPFKVIEYLAAGNHVITTPRGVLEPELEAGVTYIANNSPAEIAACLKAVMQNARYEQTAEEAAMHTYGPAAITQSLNRLVTQVTKGSGQENLAVQNATLAASGAR